MSYYPSEKISKYSFEPNGSRNNRHESPRRGLVNQPRSNILQSNLHRQLSPSSRALASYKASITSPKSANPDFFSSLVAHMRRIDENFTLEWSNDTPLQQALNCLIQAIEVIESERTHDPSLYPQPSQEYTETNENLVQYEQLLKSKEEQLKNDEAFLQREKQLISTEKEKVKRLKDHYQELEIEIKEQKKRLDAKEKEDESRIAVIKDKLEKELNSLEEQKRIIFKEAHEIEIIKNKLEEYSSNLAVERDELEADRAKLFEKTLEIDKEKWRLENEAIILEEKTVINNHLKETIDLELKNIESERAELLKYKVDFHSEAMKSSEGQQQLEEEKLLVKELQNALMSERLALAEDRERLTLEEERVAQILEVIEKEKRKMSEGKTDPEAEREAEEAWEELDEKQPDFIRNNKEEDYSHMLEELQVQMMNYNKEVEIREREIELKNLALSQREEEIEKKLEEIQNVEFSLLRAKHDLEELSLGTIPELESQSQHIQQILADLLMKRSEVDSGYNQLQAKMVEFERSKSRNSNKGGNDISRLADELEAKIKKVKQHENELAALEAELEKEKKENLAHALFLQRTQKEFNQNAALKEAEIQEAMKKLEIFQKKIENMIN